MGQYIAAFGAVLALLGLTPLFFGHPYRHFIGVRLAVGVTVLVACAGMTVSLLQASYLYFFGVASLTTALLWLGSTYLLDRLDEEAAQSARQRRRARRKLGPFSLIALAWIGALAQAVGGIISLAGL